MSPLDLAAMLAASPDLDTRALAVGIVLRGLTDPARSPLDRQPWPLDETSANAAAVYLGIMPTPELLAAAILRAPTISDAMLNTRPTVQAEA